MTRQEAKKIILEKYVLGKETKLPSENQLAKEFGLHRLTIRKTLEELRDINMVYPWHGKGWFPIKQNKSLAKESNSDYLILDNTIKQAGIYSKQFRCLPTRNLGYFARIATLPGHSAPERYEETYYNLSIVGALDNEVIGTSFFNHVNNNVTRIYISRTEFFTFPCTDKVANFLSIKPGTHVLANLELTEDHKGKIISYSLNVFASNSIKVNYKHNINKIL